MCRSEAPGSSILPGSRPAYLCLRYLSRRPPRAGSTWTWEKERPMNGWRGFPREQIVFGGTTSALSLATVAGRTSHGRGGEIGAGYEKIHFDTSMGCKGVPEHVGVISSRPSGRRS